MEEGINELHTKKKKIIRNIADSSNLKNNIKIKELKDSNKSNMHNSDNLSDELLSDIEITDDVYILDDKSVKYINGYKLITN